MKRIRFTKISKIRFWKKFIRCGTHKKTLNVSIHFCTIYPHTARKSKGTNILLIYSLFKGQQQKNQLIPFECCQRQKLKIAFNTSWHRILMIRGLSKMTQHKKRFCCSILGYKEKKACMRILRWWLLFIMLWASEKEDKDERKCVQDSNTNAKWNNNKEESGRNCMHEEVHTSSNA